MLTILQEFKALGGRFTLSDDSHGIAHVGLNYSRVLDCIKRAGITEIHYLTPLSSFVRRQDDRLSNVGWKVVSVGNMERHAFFEKLNGS